MIGSTPIIISYAISENEYISTLKLYSFPIKISGAMYNGVPTPDFIKFEKFLQQLNLLKMLLLIFSHLNLCNEMISIIVFQKLKKDKYINNWKNFSSQNSFEIKRKFFFDQKSLKSFVTKIFEKF